jgi:hypothetical protein
MFDTHNSFGESKYEHIPEGSPNPIKEIVKKLPPSKLIKNIKAKEAKEEHQSETDTEQSAELIRLAKLLVEGNLPPEIQEGSEFYQLLEEIAKQEL